MQDCHRIRVFDPLSTLHCFMLQALSRGSCKEALAAFNAARLKNSMPVVSMNSAAYCKARQKLNVECLEDIALESGRQVETETAAWKWREKNVFLVDGTVIQMEDSRANRKEYPLSFAQGKAQGQPKARLLGCFGLSSGALVDAELGKYVGKGQSEVTLLRRMLPRIRPESVLVLDRFFTSFFLQSEFQARGIDYVIRCRDKFAKRLLGRRKDMVFELPRPLRSEYNYDGDFDSHPPSIYVRLIKSTIVRKGFRSRSMYLITSFVDENSYEKQSIEELYLKRWHVELDIRNFKASLGGSFLRSKTPQMALREIWVRLIAYNLIRKVLGGVAAFHQQAGPRKWSFKTAISLYRNIVLRFGEDYLDSLFEMMGAEKLNAKYRREPRALKRRPHRYCYLTVPRSEARYQNWGYARRSGQRAFKEGYGPK